jgi:hypothetical protein
MKNEVLEKAGSTAGKFGSAAAGLAVGTFVMKKIPAFGPPIVQKLAPGLAGMLLAYFISTKATNEYAKSAALGLGLAGFVNALKNTVGDKLPGFLSENLALSGVGYVQNTGEYGPDWFAQPVNGFENSLLGVGNAPDVNRLLI